MFKGPLEERG